MQGNSSMVERGFTCPRRWFESSFPTCEATSFAGGRTPGQGDAGPHLFSKRSNHND